MHDFQETYIGDISNPMKQAVKALVEINTGVAYNPLKELSAIWDKAICQKFGLPEEIPEEVFIMQI